MPSPPAPAFHSALLYWLKLGFISFGGPAGQIATMHRELVERRRWISENHFLHALNFCMLLPGPEAQQLATYLGWRLHGVRGGVAAGALFVLPSVLILFALSWLYMTSGDVLWLAALFYGLLPAVIAIVAAALLRIGRKALKTPALWALAAASFVAIFFFKVSFVIIIAAAALAGWAGSHWMPQQFPSGTGGAGTRQEEEGFVVLPPCPAPSWKRTGMILSVCLVLWWLPVLLTGLWLGQDSTIFRQGLFFSQTALITFGGAYAVLPYVAQQAVEHFRWLTWPQMAAGLGLAETTPGPLIMVLQFVGFAGAWQHPPEGFSPLSSALLGGLLTTWVTFLPCFLFVFTGAPHVEQLRDHPRLGASMTAITAAVVGVILNLGVWFAQHAIWPAGWTETLPLHGTDLFVVFVSIAAFAALHRYKAGVMPVIGACALLGLVWKLALR
ncbi:MAG TPA: chromate efflux transporter [Verrucomicrobiales bacterium]|nr:chromate efflux transporter [Verrucomicrobiales bacterium]